MCACGCGGRLPTGRRFDVHAREYVDAPPGRITAAAACRQRLYRTRPRPTDADKRRAEAAQWRAQAEELTRQAEELRGKAHRATAKARRLEAEADAQTSILDLVSNRDTPAPPPEVSRFDPALDRDCESCGARRGARCTSSRGNPLPLPHACRRAA